MLEVRRGNSNKDQTTAQSNQENDPSSPANDGETDEKKDASSAADTDAETTMEKGQHGSNRADSELL